MPVATYTLKVDLNRNFSFADADEDLSSRLMSAHWFNGFQSPYDHVCRDSTAEFVLRNNDKRVSPEAGGAIAGLDMGKTVTLDMTYGGTTRMWTGWIDKPIPEPGIYGARSTKLMCNSWVTRAGRTKNWIVPMQRNKTVDNIIPELIDRTACFPPGLSGLIWLLGIPGLTELDVSTYLSDSTVYLTAETGGVTIALVGNRWSAQTTLLNAIKEVVDREGNGRLWLGRNGKLQFWNRDHLLLNTTINKSYTGADMKLLKYEYASVLFNTAIVNFANTRVGSAPEILGVNNTELTLVAGETKNVSYRYADQTTGVSVGGQDELSPAIGTDYNAWTGRGSTGAAVVGGISAAVNNSGSTGATVAFTNANTFPVYIAAGSQVRGTKVVDISNQSMLATDATSVAARGSIEFTIGGTVEGADYAQSLANYWLKIGKDPRGYVRSITLMPGRSAALMADVQALGIGSQVTITETQTGTSGNYFIISEEHWVTMPISHTVTYGLEPAGSQQVWLLNVTGYSELDTTAILAPW